MEEIWIAISVAREREQLLLEHLKVRLASIASGEVQVVALPRIPRNSGGKIQRELLRKAIIEATKPRAPS